MRCLYCNKKLSLLKLAKGDSFCSPEHFDAHQLQLSKDAFDRLKSVPAEEAPKEPLLVKPPDDRAEHAALARLSALAPPPLSETVADQSPPYAPFASSPLPPFWQDTPPLIASGPEAEEAVESAQDLAFPVHDPEAIVCILNLYLRLSLAETEPSDWTPMRDFIATPEEFRPEINQPPFALSPEFPQIENLAAADPEPPLEAIRPVDTAPLIQDLAPDEGAPPIKVVMPSEAPPVAIARRRLPFHVAPSFRARTGTPVALHSAAAPVGSVLDPAIEKSDLPRLDSCDSIPNSAHFAINEIKSQNATASWIKSASEIAVQPSSVLPDSKPQICKEAWQPSDREIIFAVSALEAKWVSTRPLGFDLPVPGSLMARPNPVHLSKPDPQQLLEGTPMAADSLFLGVLQTSPLGQQPLVVDRPASAMEPGWQATLAPFPARKPFPMAWQDRTVYSSLRDPIAESSMQPLAPLEQRPYPETCVKMDRIENIDLAVPYVAKDRYCSTEWQKSDYAWAPLPAQPGLAIKGLAMLPHAFDMPGRSLSTGPGTPALRWDLQSPPAKASLLVKFLPARNGAILPPAKDWQRLESVPR
jgi:hypothetical protein